MRCDDAPLSIQPIQQQYTNLDSVSHTNRFYTSALEGRTGRDGGEANGLQAVNFIFASKMVPNDSDVGCHLPVVTPVFL